jgi:hypothetical protein
MGIKRPLTSKPSSGILTRHIIATGGNHMLRGPTDNTINYSTVALIGDEGSYKTLLASTFPHAYFIDVDGGAAHTRCWRLGDIPKNAHGYRQVKDEIAKLERLTPGKDGLLTHSVDGTSFQVGTVVLDTLDETQILASFGVPQKDPRKYYRELLRRLRDEIVYPLKNINAHVIVVAHTKTWSVDNEQKQAGQITQRTLALEGAIRNALPGWFDVILHIVNEGQGRRMMLTQPTIQGQWRFLAKDRYNVFGGRKYEIKMVGDKPDPSLAQAILERTCGGVKPVQLAAERDRVKGAWVEHAKSRKILGSSPSAEEIRLLKRILGDVYDDVQSATDNFDGLIERGVELINNYKEEEG